MVRQGRKDSGATAEALADEPDRFACPICHGSLATGPESFGCRSCARDYPLVLGIPDFRLFPDPYIGIEEDRAKARRIAARAASTDFAGLLEFYWSITEDTPGRLAGRFIRHARSAYERAGSLLDDLGSQRGASSSREARVLELGCRAGGLLAAAAERHGATIGIDIALRWLVLARKQLEERGIQARLACACAEHLPLPARSFDLVLAENVIEHVRTPQALVSEAYRVLRPGGQLYGLTCNRLSLGPEPHVRVWGVGFLPRRWMEPYVRLVRRVPYRHVHLLSPAGLRSLLDASPFGGTQALDPGKAVRIDLPRFDPRQVDSLSAAGRGLARAYNTLRDWPIVRSVLALVAPVLRFRCRRDEGTGPTAGEGAFLAKP